MIKSNSNIEEKRAFEFTLEGFNKEGGTFWHYFEIPVNIFQKLCLKWWGGGDGREGGWKQTRGWSEVFKLSWLLGGGHWQHKKVWKDFKVFIPCFKINLWNCSNTNHNLSRAKLTISSGNFADFILWHLPGMLIAQGICEANNPGPSDSDVGIWDKLRTISWHPLFMLNSFIDFRVFS